MLEHGAWVCEAWDGGEVGMADVAEGGVCGGEDGGPLALGQLKRPVLRPPESTGRNEQRGLPVDAARGPAGLECGGEAVSRDGEGEAGSGCGQMQVGEVLGSGVRKAAQQGDGLGSGEVGAVERRQHGAVGALSGDPWAEAGELGRSKCDEVAIGVERAGPGALAWLALGFEPDVNVYVADGSRGDSQLRR